MLDFQVNLLKLVLEPSESMNEPCNVLLIGGPLACEAELCGSGHAITHVATYSEGIQQLARGKFEAVLVDLSLVGSRDLEALCKSSGPVEIPVVVLADRTIQKAAFQALSIGAQDYLIKGQVDGEVLRAIAEGVVIPPGRAEIQLRANWTP